MLIPIPGNQTHFVSENGEIVYKWKNDSVPECTLDVIDGFVELEFFGVKQKLSKDWVVNLARYNVCFDKPEDYNNVFFIDGRMIFKQSMEPVKGLRVVPGYTRYLVSKKGDLYDTVEGTFILPERSGRKDHYPRVIVECPLKRRKKFRVLHRLVALAWVPNPDPATKLYVNHIDGVKKNCHYKNLEWVTTRENNVHAVKAGLIPTAVACMIRNVHTGEVKEYCSLMEASRGLGINISILISSLSRARQTKLIKGVYEIRLDGDNRPWVHEDRIKKAGRYIVTVRYPDGSEEHFHDTRDVIKRFKLWNMGSSGLSTILARMKRDYPDYVVTYVDQYDTRPIQCLKVSDRSTIETGTIKELSVLIGVDHRIIRNRLAIDKKNGKLYEDDGYAIRYKTDESWPEVIEPRPSKSKCILATHKKTGQRVILASLREAAKHFSVDRSVLTCRLGKDKDYKDWLFSEIREEKKLAKARYDSNVVQNLL